MRQQRASYINGYIGGNNWIAYESHAIKHLPVKARQRLVELYNQGYSYETSEAMLISEGFYKPDGVK